MWADHDDHISTLGVVLIDKEVDGITICKLKQIIRIMIYTPGIPYWVAHKQFILDVC